MKVCCSQCLYYIKLNDEEGFCKAYKINTSSTAPYCNELEREEFINEQIYIFGY